MPFISDAALVCPLDGESLTVRQNVLCCPSGHAFDMSREGYVNLLGPADKRSRQPGDSRDMVAARRLFLAQGHYAPLVSTLWSILAPLLRPGCRVVDAGCGEGYYLRELQTRYAQRGVGAAAWVGFDISKWAVKAAARSGPATWLVASNRRIPLADGSADIVLDIFGFLYPSEFARVLKPGGCLLRCTAGPDHLLSLRELVYPEVRRRPEGVGDIPGFAAKASEVLRFPVVLEQPAEISALLQMTPHFYRAPHAGRERALALESFEVTAEVVVQQWRRGSVQSPTP